MRTFWQVFLFGASALVLWSGNASATIINTAGNLIDNMEPAPNLTSTGWGQTACPNCAKGSGGGGNLFTGPTGNDIAALDGGHFLDLKDTQNTGFYVALPDSFGSTTCTGSPSVCTATVVDISRFNNDTIYFYTAFQGNTAQFGQGFGAGYGDIFITGGLGCTVTNSGASGANCWTVKADFGTINSPKTWYLFSGSMSYTNWIDINTNAAPTSAQWLEILKNVNLIVMDVSTHSTNSNDVISIDNIGFTTAPEPATFGLIGIALAGGLWLRRRK